MLEDKLRSRVLEEARYFVNTQSTVRETAKVFGVAKRRCWTNTFFHFCYTVLSFGLLLSSFLFILISNNFNLINNIIDTIITTPIIWINIELAPE